MPARPLEPTAYGRQPIGRIISMPDRNSGEIWYLTYAADESAYVHITTEAPPDRFASQVQAYDSENGPWMDKGIRLFIRNGRLGYDMPQLDSPRKNAVTSAPVAARRLWKRFCLYLQLGPWRKPGDALGYKEVRI